LSISAALTSCHERLPGISETARIFAGVEVDAVNRSRAADGTIIWEASVPTNCMEKCNLEGTAIQKPCMDAGLLALGERLCGGTFQCTALTGRGSNSSSTSWSSAAPRATCDRGAVRPGDGHARPPEMATDGQSPADPNQMVKRKTPAGNIRLPCQRTMATSLCGFRTGSWLDDGRARN